MAQQVENVSVAKSVGMPRITAKAIMLVILAAAIGVSGYLSWLKIANADAVCVHGGRFDCGVVLNSAYSEIAGIPIAWLGLATNFIIVGLLLLQNRIKFLRQNGTLIVFGVVLFAFIYSVYLVYLQAFVIQRYCPWCLTHEALITLLFIVSARQAWVAMGNDPEIAAT
ncbi:MAG: vitamin K epoxide reductase family protein [Chloroflexota bacterium]